MKNIQEEKAFLVLEDGTFFEGNAIGKIGSTEGEIAFNTGMTGYQEIFTDPSYFGQILIMTTPHIGNYGVKADEVESESIKLAGLVTKKFSEYFSRAGESDDTQEYLSTNELVGICNVDTRKLVRHIRSTGAMNAIISSDGTPLEELREKVKSIPSMQGLELSSKVATATPYILGEDNAPIKVALLDFGVKQSIIRCLNERGCIVKVFPLNSKVEDILNWKPDGLMFSNGPGDPAVMEDQIAKTKKLLEHKIPSFGICLGHQIICLSQGLKTEKMFNGHRGINHPVKNIISGKSEITSQNHGFVVTQDSVSNNNEVELTHVHLNDDTVAGIRLKNSPVFSVQYHPEASAGPHDSRYLFDMFVSEMKHHKN